MTISVEVKEMVRRLKERDRVYCKETCSVLYVCFGDELNYMQLVMSADPRYPVIPYEDWMTSREKKLLVETAHETVYCDYQKERVLLEEQNNQKAKESWYSFLF